MDVAKVDRDVAYVAMVVHLCCKCLSLIFHLFFQIYVASVFVWKLHMLQIFYLDIAYVLQRFSSVLCVFYQCFRCIFQIFHLSSDVCCKYFIWMFQK
jgi:hypothetical protein